YIRLYAQAIAFRIRQRASQSLGVDIHCSHERAGAGSAHSNQTRSAADIEKRFSGQRKGRNVPGQDRARSKISRMKNARKDFDFKPFYARFDRYLRPLIEPISKKERL